MKTKLTLLLAVLLPLATHAADDLSAALQKGLFEEEANQNLTAAIQAYQSLLAASDEQRKLAATALFRLGECYRKLGQTNDAIAQYQRLIRDFEDQTTLATLSRQNLAGLDKPEPSLTRFGGASGNADQIRLIEQQLMELKADSARSSSLLRQFEALTRGESRQVIMTAWPDALLASLLDQLAQAQQKYASITASFATDHPQVKAAISSIESIETQVDERISGIMAGMRLRAKAEDARAESLQKHLNELTSMAAEPTHLSANRTVFADSATRAKLKSLLQEEIELAQKIASEQHKRIEVGTMAVGEAVRFERDVLGLKRQLLVVDGLATPKERKRWRELMQEEIALTEQAVAFEQKKVENGKQTPLEVSRAQRELMSLKRELVTFDATPGLLPVATSATHSRTTSPAASAAQEELQRTEQMLARLQGWDTSQLRKLLPTVIPDADLETWNTALMQAEQVLLVTVGDKERQTLMKRIEELRQRTEIRIAEILDRLRDRANRLRKPAAQQ